MYDDLYDGVPVIALPVIEVDVPDPSHLRRSLRYPNAADADPVAAIEAALDPRSLIARDPKSHTGEAIRIIGFHLLLVVVLLSHEHSLQGWRRTGPKMRHDDASRSRTSSRG